VFVDIAWEGGATVHDIKISENVLKNWFLDATMNTYSPK